MVGKLVNDVASVGIIFEGAVENIFNLCSRFLCYSSWLRDDSSEKIGTLSSMKIRSFMIATTF